MKSHDSSCIKKDLITTVCHSVSFSFLSRLKTIPVIFALLLITAAFFTSCASNQGVSGKPSGPELGNSSALAASTGTSPWIPGVTVAVAEGTLRGKKDTNNTYAWLGIPYAASPTGDSRWMPPKPVEHWDGLRDVTRFGSKAVQSRALIGGASGSEDSLYLNVWRPASKDTELPVYVWIHGGGNSSGAADALPSYQGQIFASRTNAVFVSFNYRLGVLGWFNHPALKTGEPLADSGNFGTLDIIAALSWIKTNIKSFGGDPDSVTIAGESAGAFNILTLLASPKASGLFHRAVVQSGYRTRVTPAQAEDFAVDFGLRLLVKKGLARDVAASKALVQKRGDAWLASVLRSATPRELLSLMKAGPSGMLDFPYPVWDGTLLPSDGFESLGDPERSARVPMIIGTNLEESKLFQWLGRQNWRDPLYQAKARLGALGWKMEGADSIADLYASMNQSTEGVPYVQDLNRSVYLYRFDWGAPDASGKSVMGGTMGAQFGSFHSLEIPFFLQSDTVLGRLVPLPFFTKANQTGRHALQADILVRLSSFMRSGSPNPGSSPVPAESGVTSSGAKTGMPSASPYSPGSGFIFWEAWDPSSESPSFLVLDAGLEELKVRLQKGRTTEDSILRSLESDYPGSLHPALREWMTTRE